MALKHPLQIIVFFAFLIVLISLKANADENIACSETALYQDIKTGKINSEVALVSRQNCGGCTENTQDTAGIATLEVSVLSRGKGKGGRNITPAKPTLIINGTKLKPTTSEKYWVERPSSGQKVGKATFAALGVASGILGDEAVKNEGEACEGSNHQKTNRSTTEKVIDGVGMAAGIGAMATQIKGQITGRKSCFVLTQNGETVVIGDISLKTRVKNDVTDKSTLVNIPLVGNLFRSVEEKDQKNNLLIFLTPQIIKDTE